MAIPQRSSLLYTCSLREFLVAVIPFEELEVVADLL